MFAVASADISMNAPEPYLLYPSVIVLALRQQGGLEWLPVFIDRQQVGGLPDNVGNGQLFVRFILIERIAKCSDGVPKPHELNIHCLSLTRKLYSVEQ
ncbi:hypothetical protein D3C72_2289520 [compost metagenome]